MPSYKINYSGGKFRVVNVNKLPNKTTLQSLDRVYLGQPFLNTVSKFQDTRGLDTVYLGQPFYGHTDGIALPTVQSFTTNHPEVDNWLKNISLNGGSASSTTVSALNTFCNTIDSAGLRGKFYRLNLFCGNNLQACLVPLYVNTQLNAPVLGFGIDVNINFVSSDYNETGSSGGLNTQSSFSRYLNIGTIPSMNAASQHLSTYVRLRSGQTNLDGFGLNLAGAGWETRIHYRSALAGRVWIGAQFWGGTFSPISTVTQTTFVLGSRTSSSNMFVHFNGVANGSDTETRSIPAASSASVSVCSQGAGVYLNGIIAAYSFGVGMTTTEAAVFNSAMQTFQTALNRNV